MNETYIKLGFSIIPLGSITKDAHNKKVIEYPKTGWKQYQTKKATLDEVRKWKYKNVGILTGTISGIVVLDVDSYKENFDKELVKSLNIPITPVQKTANGGRQYFFKLPKGIIIQNGVDLGHKGSGIDVRGEGGMVIAPPTVTSYGVYEWEISPEDTPLAELTPHLLEFITKHAGTEQKVKKELSDLVSLNEGEGRNTAMASFIGKLLVTTPIKKWDTEVWTMAVEVNKTYNPPMALSELQTIYDSITKTAQKQKKPNDEIEFLTTTKIIKDKKVDVYNLNLENICRILRHHNDYKDRFRYDEFSCQYEIKPANATVFEVLKDHHVLDVQATISMLYDFTRSVSKPMVLDAITKVSQENAYDAAKDYVQSLKWDKKARIDTWLEHVYGVDASSSLSIAHYHKTVGSNWIKGLVNRLVNPGCKFDYVLVLEGAQGSKKSSSFAELMGDWHVETTMSTDSKDFFLQLQGKSIIEFSEGETLNRTEVKRMKAIITTQVDRFRIPFERATRDFPRRCVFAMTTNQEYYLKDETGNRRWLPVKVQKEQADLEWIKENKEQMFAEAYYRLTKLKETYWEFPIDETIFQQQSRRIIDPNAEIIEDWYFNKLSNERRREGVSILEAYALIHTEPFPKPISTYDSMLIGSIFSEVLGLKKERVRQGGAKVVKWFPTDKTPQVEPDEDKDALLNKIEKDVATF